jgi:hypothetical protein
MNTQEMTDQQLQATLDMVDQGYSYDHARTCALAWYPTPLTVKRRESLAQARAAKAAKAAQNKAQPAEPAKAKRYSEEACARIGQISKERWALARSLGLNSLSELKRYESETAPMRAPIEPPRAKRFSEEACARISQVSRERWALARSLGLKSLSELRRYEAETAPVPA